MSCRYLWLLLAVCAAPACAGDEPCGVPGVVEQCACGGIPGARVCEDDKTWRACDCSGSIALPNAVLQVSGAGGSGAGGMSAGSSASGAGGSGGRAGTGGTGGTAGTDAGMIDQDSGMPPVGGESGAAGEAGSAGAGEGGAGAGAGEGGAGGDGGQVDPSTVYRGCSTPADCDPSARCTITSGFPTDSSVCAPRCVDVGECPVPEGTYEAVVTCASGFCQLDCTPVLFAPLLSCPTGMTCIAPPFGVALCHDDGM